jgi:hypothetical protein
MILWDDSILAVHDMRGGSLKHKLNLEGLDVSSDESRSGKRSKKSETTSLLANAASVYLSKDYYAVVANSREDQTVIVAVIDSQYGAIHLAEDISQGLEQNVGRTSGVSLTALSGSLVIGLSDQVLVVQFDLPELSLASLVGSLSIHVQPDVSAAAARVLGSQASSTSTPTQHASVTPIWDVNDLILGGHSVFNLGACTEAWNHTDTQAHEKKVCSAAEALASGSKKAKSLLEPLMKQLPIPQILIDSAISGCLTHRSWEPMSMLLAEGHISGSSAAHQLVSALVEEDMLDELKNFFIHAIDVAPTDISATLVAYLSLDESDSGLKKRAKENRILAEKALDEAEATSPDDKGIRQRTAARAQLLVGAYDLFAPWAQQLHSLIARPLDPTTGLKVLRSLSKEQCVSLLRYLLVWTKFYAASGALFAEINTLAESGIPSAQAVVSWASALLDAQLAMLCLTDEAAELIRELRDSSGTMLEMMRPLATLKGALRHVTENSPLPEQHGVVSTTYTVESVAW